MKKGSSDKRFGQKVLWCWESGCERGEGKVVVARELRRERLRVRVSVWVVGWVWWWCGWNGGVRGGGDEEWATTACGFMAHCWLSALYMSGAAVSQCSACAVSLCDGGRARLLGVHHVPMLVLLLLIFSKYFYEY